MTMAWLDAIHKHYEVILIILQVIDSMILCCT